MKPSQINHVLCAFYRSLASRSSLRAAHVHGTSFPPQCPREHEHNALPCGLVLITHPTQPVRTYPDVDKKPPPTNNPSTRIPALHRPDALPYFSHASPRPPQPLLISTASNPADKLCPNPPPSLALNLLFPYKSLDLFVAHNSVPDPLPSTDSHVSAPKTQKRHQKAVQFPSRRRLFDGCPRQSGNSVHDRVRLRGCASGWCSRA